MLEISLDLGYSDHYPGSVSYLEIFQIMKNWHVRELKKTEEEIEGPDHGLFSAEFPNMWGLLADKGYKLLLEIVRGITPKKKPRGILGLSDEYFKRQISSDQIAVENISAVYVVFGRFHRKNGDG